ncbi:UvrD-helicase domain-containing protein, partial [Candidatus Omnitrophota bacterium]
MNDFSNYYEQLNPRQAQAVDAIDGPLLILAGPGTGKTQLLSVRAASILKKKRAEPENILILTYTNAAVKAMKDRLYRIIGPSGYGVEVATFHSFANSVIHDSEESADYIQEKIQISDIEKVRAIEHILDNTKGLGEIRPFGAPYLYRREILGSIRDLKNEGISPDGFTAFLKRYEPDGSYIQQKHMPRLSAFGEVYRRYEDLKSGRRPGVFDERGRYDYEDMIIIAGDALKSEPLLRGRYAAQYTFIMVDEFQ